MIRLSWLGLDLEAGGSLRLAFSDRVRPGAVTRARPSDVDIGVRGAVQVQRHERRLLPGRDGRRSRRRSAVPPTSSSSETSWTTASFPQEENQSAPVLDHCEMELETTTLVRRGKPHRQAPWNSRNRAPGTSLRDTNPPREWLPEVAGKVNYDAMRGGPCEAARSMRRESCRRSV